MNCEAICIILHRPHVLILKKTISETVWGLSYVQFYPQISKSDWKSQISWKRFSCPLVAPWIQRISEFNPISLSNVVLCCGKQDCYNPHQQNNVQPRRHFKLLPYRSKKTKRRKLTSDQIHYAGRRILQKDGNPNLWIIEPWPIFFSLRIIDSSTLWLYTQDWNLHNFIWFNFVFIRRHYCGLTLK